MRWTHGELERPHVEMLVQPGVQVEQHSCSLPGPVETVARIVGQPSWVPCSPAYVDALVRCDECGQHWHARGFGGSSAYWVPVTARAARRLVRKAERAERRGQR
jgi:hypothetical protein